MYLDSNSPIPLIACQRQKAACKTAASAERVQATRQLMAQGRVGIFETMLTPEVLTDQFGIGLGVDAAKVQDQTESSRASSMLGIPAAQRLGPSMDQLVADAPTVVSLNRRKGQEGCNDVVWASRGVGEVPTPSMPHGAPIIENTTLGPMYFRGHDATYPLAQSHRTFGASPKGLTGYLPPWSDSWVMGGSSSDMGVGGWIADHPWLSLAIAGAGLFALSKRKGRR